MGDLLIRRRGMLRESRLPPGFQAVSFIGNSAQGDGYGYIDTVFTPDQNTRIRGKFRGIAPFRDRVGMTNRSFSVGRTVYSIDNTKRYLMGEYGSKHMPAGGTTISADFLRDSTGFISEDYEIDLNKNSFTLTTADATGTWTTSAQTFTAPGPLPILGLLETNSSSAVTPGAGCAFWSEIYDNGTLARDYVSCVRVSDGKPGLYDMHGSICPLTNSPFYVSANPNGDFDLVGGIIL